MEASFLTRHPSIRDALNFIGFIILVLVGTLIINTFIFRSFNVVGPSMEPTLKTGDRLIVNRLPTSVARLQNQKYVPQRNQIIVFVNPNYVAGQGDEYIVKRVIAFAGEKVTVHDGKMRVFNQDNPDGFNPNDTIEHGKPGSPVSGSVDTVVPENNIFVVGDHREGEFSCDSRGCMGPIPLYDVVGPVATRIWPLNKIDIF